MDNSTKNNIIFQSNTSIISTGTSFNIPDNASAITIEFVTTGTFSANFEAQLTSGTWYPVNGMNLGTLAMATSATDATNLYQVGTTGLVALRVNVTAISGGALSVNGHITG